MSLDQARKEWPGSNVPDMVKDPLQYITYWRKLALWGYKFGPFLLHVGGTHEASGGD